MTKAEFYELIKDLAKHNNVELDESLMDTAFALYRETEAKIIREGGCINTISMLDYYALVPDCHEQYAADQDYTLNEAVIYLMTIELAVIESGFYGKNSENS